MMKISKLSGHHKWEGFGNVILTKEEFIKLYGDRICEIDECMRKVNYNFIDCTLTRLRLCVIIKVQKRKGML